MPLEKIQKLFSDIEDAKKGSALAAIANAITSGTQPVHVILAGIPELGTQSHALYAIARALILRHGSTNEQQIIEEATRLIDCAYKENKKMHPNAENPEHDSRDMHIFFERMVAKSNLTRLPSGTIIFKK